VTFPFCGSYNKQALLMDLQDIRDRLDKFRKGKLSSAEKAALHHALDSLSEEERSDLFPVDPWLEKGAFSMPEEEVNAALSRLRKPAVLIPWKQISRYAAILVLAMGSLFFLRRNPGSDKKIAKQLRSMKVENGKQGLLVLADGTRITINGGSELLYPEKFEGKERLVYLKEGEAYFEIAKDVQHPFTVRTSQLHVRVLGTSFSVRNYSDEQQAFVSVNSGKVALDTLELTAGTGSILNKGTGILIKQAVDTAATTAWTRNELIFQDAHLQQVLQVLQHRYAVQFELKDSLLLKHRFTATFRNKSIQAIMEQLQLMSNIRSTIKNNQIVIQ
jgi:ferric-dicitrate binding protein FerR (iron transport regulator)